MIVEKTKELLLQARKSNDTLNKNILSFLLGEFDTASANKDISEETRITIIEKIIGNNNKIIKLIKGDDQEDHTTKLKQENETLISLLPYNLLNKEGLRSFIINNNINITELPFGPTIGVVSKALKAENLKYINEDLKILISELKGC